MIIHIEHIQQILSVSEAEKEVIVLHKEKTGCLVMVDWEFIFAPKFVLK